MTRLILLAALLAVCGVVGWRRHLNQPVRDWREPVPEGDVGRGGWFV